MKALKIMQEELQHRGGKMTDIKYSISQEGSKVYVVSLEADLLHEHLNLEIK